MKLPLPFLPTFFVWLITTFLTIATVFIFQSYRQNLSQMAKTEFAFAQEPSYYQMYASYPKVLGETIFSVTTDDAVPPLIKQYLTKNKSPMTEAADDLVTIARKYGLDPLLLVAIAQCESNLGKKMPTDCYNPFGWGIHSKGTLCFENWQEGFEKVAKGLKEKYLDKGLYSPYEIMTKYNYSSWKEREGSWAKCVSKFLEDLEYLK